MKNALVSAIYCLLLTPLGVLAESAEPENPTLEVWLENLSPNKGQIILSVFDSEDSFLNTPLTSTTVSIEDSSRLRVQIGKLPKGEYAIAVVYDVNSNDELDTNFIGIPTEPVGASNNAKNRFGPPNYKDAKFQLTEPLSLSIELESVD